MKRWRHALIRPVRLGRQKWRYPNSYSQGMRGVHVSRMPSVYRQAMSVYLTDSRKTWQALCRCFDAYTSSDEATPRGLYKHTLRISRDDHPIILVSSTSSRFYKLKPDAYAPIHN